MERSEQCARRRSERHRPRDVQRRPAVRFHHDASFGRRAPGPGRAWASKAATPAVAAAAALEPLIVPKRGEPSDATPGSEVAISTPGATRSGFTRPSYASPVDENGATVAASSFDALA